jgi:hypothetical protein
MLIPAAAGRNAIPSSNSRRANADIAVLSWIPSPTAIELLAASGKMRRVMNWAAMRSAFDPSVGP